MEPEEHSFHSPPCCSLDRNRSRPLVPPVTCPPGAAPRSARYDFPGDVANLVLEISRFELAAPKQYPKSRKYQIPRSLQSYLHGCGPRLGFTHLNKHVEAIFFMAPAADYGGRTKQSSFPYHR